MKKETPKQKILRKIKKVEQKNKISMARLLVVIVFCLLVAALIIVSLAYNKEKNKKLTSADIQSLQKQEISRVLDEISEHIVLPEGVQPTIATITDVDNLRKEMPFFNKAQNGFKVILYEEKAILYDPVNKIIVDVAPVIRGAQTQQQDTKDEQKLKEEDKNITKNSDETTNEEENSEKVVENEDKNEDGGINESNDSAQDE